MTKSMRWLWTAIALAAMAPTAAAQSGELFVVRVGDGVAALSASSTATFVNRYTTAGAVSGAAIALPITADGDQKQLTNAGNGTTEGFISLSTDSKYLTLAGYAVAPGLANVASSTATAAPRVVGRITVSSGAVDTRTVFNGDNTYTSGAIRSVVSTNGTDLWLGGTSTGANGGVRYATFGSNTSTMLTNEASTTLTNARVVEIANGQLYTDSGGAGFLGVISVGTGTPTSGPQAATLLSGFPTSGTHSPLDFWFKDANTVYLADDGAAGSGGGIQKWTQTAGTWTRAYTMLNSGSVITGIRGLTGTIGEGNNAVLFATTSASTNKLIKITDTGELATANATYAELATAEANTVFRGVQFVPPQNDSDFNSDGIVDGADFLTWQEGFGLTDETGKTHGNANSDTVVDDQDLAVWSAKFGGPPAVAAGGVVPEPHGLILAALGLLGVRRAARRQRRG